MLILPAMENDWHERWHEGRIGFHRDEVHPTLTDVASRQPFFNQCVFVPLAGKTVDLRWLAERGTPVIAVELVELAVRAFFEEQGLAFEVENDRALRRYRAHELDLTFYCGDLFALEPRHLRDARWTHDRASVVALNQAERTRYGEHLSEILPSSCEMLVTTFEYNQSEMEGPPFSVPLPELERIFPTYRFEHQRSRDLAAGISHLQERGLSRMDEHVYLATRR